MDVSTRELRREPPPYLTALTAPQTAAASFPLANDDSTSRIRNPKRLHGPPVRNVSLMTPSTCGTLTTVYRATKNADEALEAGCKDRERSRPLRQKRTIEALKDRAADHPPPPVTRQLSIGHRVMSLDRQALPVLGCADVSPTLALSGGPLPIIGKSSESASGRAVTDTDSAGRVQCQRMPTPASAHLARYKEGHSEDEGGDEECEPRALHLMVPLRYIPVNSSNVCHDRSLDARRERPPSYLRTRFSEAVAFLRRSGRPA